MRKLVKVSAMLAIAAIMQIGGCKLAYAERGYKAIGSERLIFPVVLFLEYKAFCEPGESFYEDEEEGDVYDEGVEAGVQKLSFKPVPFSNKNIIGAFAVVMYADGTIKYDSMSVEEIQHTKDVYSKAANSQAWKESFGEMCKKTVIRRLSKLIDLNLDKVELIKAYEEGSGFEFENQQISGGSTDSQHSFRDQIMWLMPLHRGRQPGRKRSNRSHSRQ